MVVGGLRRLIGRVALWLSVLIIVSPAVLVFLWMLSLAFKQDVENLANPPILISRQPTLDNFAEVFRRSPFGLYALNSFVVSTSTTLISLAFGVPAAYGIAKSGANHFAFLILISRMTPGLSYLIPWFILFRFVGLNNTLWALIITHLVIGLPIVIWVMLGFFESQHPDLDDAALTDGCTLWQAFVHVAMPLARPGMIVASVLSFIFSWNNFIFAVVLAGRDQRTLPVAVFNVLTFEQMAWGALAAAALLVTLPVLVITIVLQRYVVAGISAGAVRG
ncbi:MAG: carbohydrate ABC transporter permease [Chloroflexota bacterium]|nr:MAG: carbohydrate ABC transporter permease [Chloroflexota bacterium]